MIEIQNVSKKIADKPIIKDVTAKVDHGIWHIKGENGSGKSTLLNMIAGALKPDAGQIFYNKTDIFNAKNADIKKRWGICQRLPLYIRF